MTDIVSRIGSNGGILKIIALPDGEVIVGVSDTGGIEFNFARFTPGACGGTSPETLDAIYSLVLAIQSDNVTAPNPFSITRQYG